MNTDVPIDGCTIVDNHAITGGGVCLGVDPQVVVSNTILWGNTAEPFGFGSQATYTVLFGGLDPTFDHCLIEGGASGVEAFELGGSANPSFVGLLTADPDFVDESEGDYRLSSSSPAIDAGDPASSFGLQDGDLENQPRLADGRVDVGMDEHWAGLVTSLVVPGRAGERNRVTVAGASPGTLVHLFSGQQKGTLPLGFPACPSLALDVQDATLLGVVTADGSGEAGFDQYVPPALGGVLVLVQAIGLDLGTNPLTCEVSNLTEFPLL